MWESTLTVALVSEVFYQDDGPARLDSRLAEARERGAQLAVLPEISHCRWAPSKRVPSEADAEPPGGPRHQELARAARKAGIGLVGGCIVQNPQTGVRHNNSLVFDADGRLIATYQKLHIPDEPGFWESDHYAAGTEPPRPIDAFGMPFGLQICSDNNRPEGSHLLGAMGAEAIIVPRATELVTYPRWQVVFRANALTSTAYVLSVNRPSPEDGVLIGGPSVVVDPEGRVLVETIDAVAVARLSRDAVRSARVHYPGYLAVHADLYARAWAEVAATASSTLSRTGTVT
ncbi:MAG: carbon-nitrogen hydrolase family protein [Candidatus Wallbacteria bacterium]|nr:carbon-nitrogen hydrolase family protein [Candidatus Wallbacteria bacterium]